jgi:chromosome segregation ATPase
MLISEIILENFMSYEYARIPLKQGVNLIFGPNGSGKSSILLAISVAFGQSYTERSKKLSDLIRWNKDMARVTLILDNSRKKGRRPVSRINNDQIFLTRVLRKDGKYWFELNNTSANKADIIRLLSHFGVDPDNMLIIMHQDMAEQFIVLSSREKLILLEEAVGLEPFRRNVIEAQNKLGHIISQEESLGKMLESAEQTLNYWREQYDRFQLKKQFTLKKRFLERELVWAKVKIKEEKIDNLKEKIYNKNEVLKKLKKEIQNSKLNTEKLGIELKKINDFLKTLYGKGKINDLKEILKIIEELKPIKLLKNKTNGKKNSDTIKNFNELLILPELVNKKIVKIEKEIILSKNLLKKIKNKIENIKNKIEKTFQKIDILNKKFVQE